MVNETKAVNFLGRKSARACESCLLKRARWFCAADDAFLCQACDTSVHSANQLASRHERIRLETSSCKGTKHHHDEEKVFSPAWHQGFTRKARTPRHGKKTAPAASYPLPLVPELSTGDDPLSEESEEQLFFRVPDLEPSFLDEFCLAKASNTDLNLDELLTEFVADVESLLNEDESPSLIGTDDDRRVLLKVEEDDEVEDVNIYPVFDPALDMELQQELDSSHNPSSDGKKERRMLLRLNHEAVLSDWAAPIWSNGIGPDIHESNLEEFMDGIVINNPYTDGDGIMMTNRSSIDAAVREARVSRYREKRRTRLFSKKIRYQVRKLNAEKRPRIKGRFVKRSLTSFCN